MPDKVKVWVLIHCYRVMLARSHDLQIIGTESNFRRYLLANTVYREHYEQANSWERHALYEYAEWRDS